MNKNRKILALIVARKNSKGLKDKNIYKIKSKPCVYWTFKAAKKSKHINLSMLSTDSYKIISMAKKMKIFCPFVRPSRLSSDNSKVIDVIKHSIKWLKKNRVFKYQYLLLLQASSPFRTSKHIDKAIKFYFKNKKSDKDTLVSVNKAPKKTFWLLNKKNKYVNFVFKQFKNSRRQNNPVFFVPNGAIYLCKIKYLNKGFFNSRTLFFEMDKKSSIDIDTIEDTKYEQFQ